MSLGSDCNAKKRLFQSGKGKVKNKDNGQNQESQGDIAMRSDHVPLPFVR
jgi:hypothetical protein